MSNILELDLILNRQKYPKIYKITFIINIIIIVSLYILFTFNYQSYYLIQGRVIDNKLELLVPINDIKYIKNNNKLTIDDQTYLYKLNSISSELYISNDYKNCQYIYLDVDNLVNTDNYIYEIKIPKENKTFAKYLKDYL